MVLNVTQDNLHVRFIKNDSLDGFERHLRVFYTLLSVRTLRKKGQHRLFHFDGRMEL